ncbi:hypothetical protein BASA81_016260 [Batrachochytrium salamandrivorans]|nr:hypothetical protein BASA81_016260 [Batrachochytrium salamandrivorans]
MHLLLASLALFGSAAWSKSRRAGQRLPLPPERRPGVRLRAQRQGALGTGDVADSAFPVQMLGVLGATDIAGGLEHVCIVDQGDAARCVGASWAKGARTPPRWSRCRGSRPGWRRSTPGTATRAPCSRAAACAAGATTRSASWGTGPRPRATPPGRARVRVRRGAANRARGRAHVRAQHRGQSAVRGGQPVLGHWQELPPPRDDDGGRGPRPRRGVRGLRDGQHVHRDRRGRGVLLGHEQQGAAGQRTPHQLRECADQAAWAGEPGRVCGVDGRQHGLLRPGRGRERHGVGANLKGQLGLGDTDDRLEASAKFAGGKQRVVEIRSGGNTAVVIAT